MRIDRRTKEYREARRAPLPTPEIYFVEDFGMSRYRVGRTDWSGDVFELVSISDFETFRAVYERLGFQVKNLTHDDGGDE